MLKALYYPDVPFDSLFVPYIYKEIYLEGVYNDVMNSFRGTTDKIIVDIGSNIGITVQYFRDFAKKVYAVEPASGHFEALAKNKEFNKWDNVEVFNMAIADQDGEMELKLNENNRTMHSLVIGEKTGEGKYKIKDSKTQIEGAGVYQETEIVKTQTFNTFFKENKIEVVDFMKFDTEGAEESILCAPGFADVAPIIKSMMVEFHFPSFPKIVDHLVSLGFKARRYPSSACIVLFEH